LAIVVFAAIILGLGLFYLTRSKKEKGGTWFQFFSKGKEEGFSIREMEQLRQLGVSCGIDDPASIFNSERQLEICIRTLVRAVRMSEEKNDPSVQSFLSKLFDFCKKLEMEASDIKVRIKSSRQMSEGQAVRILVPGTGVFKSEVIKNTGSYLMVSRPVNNKTTGSLQWNGTAISIYFWRDNDAGYVFDTQVADEVFSKGIASLKVEQCDSLFRTQKRKSLRIKYKKPAFLYLAGRGGTSSMPEKKPGINCLMEDLSDKGCAFRIKGQANVGMCLKVQFAVNKTPVCMSGTVRSVDFSEETNMSLVRMEANPLPIEMRNRILGEVFRMLPEEDEEELPFRILEKETETVSPAQEDSSSLEFQEGNA
jgi:c-di-GMP-binding flagellar brake protein YcgR